ncbi:Uncharacterised protein [Shigella sonnei]|nr:Uncharacterised protein [Shigella sonnei]
MRRQNAPGMCDNTMKGSKNDYATFTGAIPASGSWQPGKTNPGRPCSGDSSGMDIKTRGGSCWSVRYFVRRRTESRCPHPGVDAGDGIYC